MKICNVFFKLVWACWCWLIISDIFLRDLANNQNRIETKQLSTCNQWLFIASTHRSTLITGPGTLNLSLKACFGARTGAVLKMIAILLILSDATMTVILWIWYSSSSVCNYHRFDIMLLSTNITQLNQSIYWIMWANVPSWVYSFQQAGAPFLVKPMLVNMHVQTWLLIGCQHNQSIRNHVKNPC